MKNVFGMNIDTDEMDAKKFLAREADAALLDRQEQMDEDLDDYGKRVTSKPRNILLLISMLIAGGCLIIFFELLMEDVVVWSLLAVGVPFTVMTILLIYIQHRKLKVVMASDEFQVTVSRAEQLAKESKCALGVPADAAEIDVLCFAYKVKKGKIKQAQSACEFYNAQMWVFTEGDSLCFADVAAVYAIPLSTIRGVFRAERKITFIGWNKEEEEFKKEPYKAYKIAVDGNGVLWMRGYCSLQCTVAGEAYEVAIPAYDIEPVLRLTGLSLREAEETC